MPDAALENKVNELDRKCTEYARLFRALGKFSEKERDILLKAIAEEERLRDSVESLKVLEVRVVKLEKIINRLPTPKVNRDILDKMDSLHKRLRSFETELSALAGASDVKEATAVNLDELDASLEKKLDTRVMDIAGRISALENAVVKKGSPLEARMGKLETLVDTLVDIVQAKGPVKMEEVPDVEVPRKESPAGEPADWKDTLLSAHNQLALALKTIKNE